jgi:hypothetical protein
MATPRIFQPDIDSPQIGAIYGSLYDDYATLKTVSKS